MVKLTVRDRESIQEAVRRFRKLVEEVASRKRCDDENFSKSQAKQSDGLA